MVAGRVGFTVTTNPRGTIPESTQYHRVSECDKFCESGVGDQRGRVGHLAHLKDVDVDKIANSREANRDSSLK